MASNERVTLTAELRDEVTAPLKNLNSGIDATTRKIDQAHKSTQKSTEGTRSALDRFAKGGTESFQRFSGGVRSGLDRGREALSGFASRVANSEGMFGKFVRGSTKGLQNLASGFKSPQAAASSFTGRLGTIGGVAARGAAAVGGIGRALAPAAQAAGNVMGRVGEIASSAASAGAAIASNIVSSLGTAATRAGKVAAILGGLVIAEGMRGGLSRAMNIEDAEARMRGMGYEVAEISELMDNASEAIMGTAFRLDDAATTASQFSAAGIEAGADMERAIGLVGDSAFAAGTDFSSMSDIWAQVAARGRLDGQTMNRLLSAGVGITGELAEKFGVAEEEVTKLVSEGSVSFEDFAEVMETKVGGAAQQMAETTRGALMNVQAGLHMVGAEVAGPFMQIFRGAMNRLQEPMFALAAVTAPVFGVLTERAEKWASGMYTAGEDAAEGINRFVEPMEQVAELMRDGEGMFAAFGEVFDIDTDSGLLGVLSNVGDIASDMSPIIGIFKGIQEAGSEVGEALWDSLGSIFETLAELAPVLGTTFVTVGTLIAPILADLLGVVAEILPTVVEFASELLTALLPVLPTLATALMGVLTALLPLVPVFVDLLEAALLPVVDGIASLIDWFVNLDGSANMLRDAVLLLVGGFAIYKTAMFGARVAQIAMTTATTLATVAQRGLNLAMRANPIGLIITAITALVGGLVWFFTRTEAGSEMFANAWQWIKDSASAVVDWFTGTAVPWLQSAWDSIVAGAMWLWEGIQMVWDGIVAGAEWLWGILEPIFIFIAAVFLWVGETLWNIWTNYIKLVFDTWVTILTWVWESVLQPIFGFIASAFQLLGEAFTWVWESIIKPVFDFFGEVITWIWESIIQPVFQFIVDTFMGLGDSFMWVWETLLKPVFDFFGEVITWLWENVILPYFESMGNAWETLAGFFTTVWEEYLKPVLVWFGDTITGLYRDYVAPAIDWIVDKWDSLGALLSGIWHETIKPAFNDVRDFFTETIPGWVETGVDMIASAWDWVKGAFAKPINWVIDFVWNDGIKAAFDNVADSIGYTGSRPGKIPLIGGGGTSAGGSNTSGRGGGSTAVAAFADGGLAQKGWALVGEEGPELVNFDRPGRVYTAEETRAALTGGDSAEGGIGSPFINPTTRFASWFATRDNAVAETGRQAALRAAGWVRGKLADMAEGILTPAAETAKGLLEGHGHMGEFGSGLIDWGLGEVLEWIRGKDAEGADGSFDGPFEANPGGFNRPAQGTISSRAGRRSYWGAFGNMHYGVDIANSIGSAVRAAWSGVVKSVSGSGMDKRMVLNHGSYDTAYFHNSAHLVSPGDTVTGGQQIARMGTAGTGPHLHFEYHPGGWYNPSIARVNSLFDEGGVLPTGTTIAQNNTGLPEFVFTNRRFGQVEEALDYVSANLPMPQAAASNAGGATLVDHRVTVEPGAVQIAVEAGPDGFLSPEGLDALKDAIEEIFEESARRDY